MSHSWYRKRREGGEIVTHPHRTIFIPSTHRRNARPTELHPADLVTVYMNDEDLPLPTPSRAETVTDATHEAELSSDLTRG